jgi:hypothetical protein
VRLEGLGKLETFNELIGTRTIDSLVELGCPPYPEYPGLIKTPLKYVIPFGTIFICKTGFKAVTNKREREGRKK